MGVNSLPKTVTRQRRDCDLNPGALHRAVNIRHAAVYIVSIIRKEAAAAAAAAATRPYPVRDDRVPDDDAYCGSATDAERVADDRPRRRTAVEQLDEQRVLRRGGRVVRRVDGDVEAVDGAAAERVVGDRAARLESAAGVVQQHGEVDRTRVVDRPPVAAVRQRRCHGTHHSRSRHWGRRTLGILLSP